MKLLPMYSRCCIAPILAEPETARLYCYKCDKTIRSFAGKRREKAIAAITYERSSCYVRAMLLGEVIGYARDVPNLEWRVGGYRKVGRSDYKFVVGGTSLAMALGFQQRRSVYGFSSLARAERALRAYLT